MWRPVVVSLLASGVRQALGSGVEFGILGPFEVVERGVSAGAWSRQAAGATCGAGDPGDGAGRLRSLVTSKTASSS